MYPKINSTKKDKNSISVINYEYVNKNDLLEYLDNIANMLYGVSYHQLQFLNGNDKDFTKSNILINPSF